MFSCDFFSLKRDQLIYSSKQNIIDSYDIYPIKIGEGTDAVIYRAREHQSWGKQRAIKKIHKSYIDNTAYLKNQIDVLKKLDHPGVIKLYQIFQDEQYFFIVTELCQGEDLLKVLRRKGSFSEQQAKPLFKKIIQIISYCHANKVMHRDIKLQNLVFSMKDTTANSIKLIDFGMSFCWKLNVHKQIQETFSTNKIVGTIYYLAPQIFNEVYGPQIDIWSAGVVLFFLVTGTLPFWSDYSDQILIQHIKNRKYSLQGFDLSDQIKDLFDRIFQLQNKRITLRQILHHPWFMVKQQIESYKKLTSDKLHYLSLLPYKQTKNFQLILEYYSCKLYPNQILAIQKEEYNFSFLRWQRIHNFLNLSNTKQAIFIFLTNRLSSCKSQKYQIIFTQFKSNKENISLKTLKQFLNFQFQYIKNKQFHQNNHLHSKNAVIQSQQIQTHQENNEGVDYVKKEKICKDLLKYFTQNQNEVIGYTQFIAWIVDPKQFSLIQMNFIADQLQKSYKMLEKYSVNMIIRQIQSVIRIKLRQDQRKTKSEAQSRFYQKYNNSILLKNILPHPAKGLIHHDQSKQTQNKYLKIKSLNKGKGKNSVKHSILSSISPSFKKRKEVKPAVLNKIIQKEKQKEEGFMVLGKIKKIIMQIPYF